jgi:hypothetical protein
MLSDLMTVYFNRIEFALSGVVQLQAVIVCSVNEEGHALQVEAVVKAVECNLIAFHFV